MPDIIVHFFHDRPFANAKSSNSDTHEWINVIFCCSFSRMPRHRIVTCMNLSIASMLDKSICFGLGDPRIGSHEVVTPTGGAAREGWAEDVPVLPRVLCVHTKQCRAHQNHGASPSCEALLAMTQRVRDKARRLRGPPTVRELRQRHDGVWRTPSESLPRSPPATP